jgi:SPOR domain
MARSNGPFGSAGARPPPRRHPGDDDAFASPPLPQPNGHSNGHWPPAHPDAAQQGQGYHFPPEPEANYGYNQQYPGGPPPDPYASQQWGQQGGGYDLGNYMPSALQPQPEMDPPPFHQGLGPEPYAEPEGAYEDEFADDTQPGRARRWTFIAAALVGAIGVGGALAYTYKSVIAPSGGRVPLVKADPNIKVRPDNRTAAASDKRAQGRLGEDAPQQTTPAAAPETQEDRSAADEPGGPRRVRTIPITPGGGPPSGPVAPPPSAQAAAASAPPVPGIMLENMGPRPQPQPPPKAAPSPGRVTIGQPPPSTPPQPQAEETPPPAPVKRAPPPAQVAVKAPAPPKAAPPPPSANTGAGYVAVLSSQKTRMDALKTFADLQQKYSEALSGRVPDVQEANLGEKGIWYRVVVGPPGSRDAANGVCSQLKSAGYSHCWVNAY